MWCDSVVIAGVALCIVRTGFYSKNYVVWMAAAIRLTAPLSRVPWHCRWWILG